LVREPTEKGINGVSKKTKGKIRFSESFHAGAKRVLEERSTKKRKGTTNLESILVSFVCFGVCGVEPEERTLNENLNFSN